MVQSHNMYAAGWADRKIKTIVSNVGTTVALPDILRKRSKNINGVTVVIYKHVEMIRKFFQYFSAIDVNDHLRQGTLNLHTHWHTNTWWHRLHGTLLGMIITDSYLAYKIEFSEYFQNEDEGEMMSFMDFVDRLAHDLIFNTVDLPPAAIAGIRRPRSEDSDDVRTF